MGALALAGLCIVSEQDTITGLLTKVSSELYSSSAEGNGSNSTINMSIKKVRVSFFKVSSSPYLSQWITTVVPSSRIITIISSIENTSLYNIFNAFYSS